MGELGDVTVKALGSVSLIVDDVALPLTTSERQVLAILVAAGALGLSKDALADELWGESLPKTWESSLRTRISLINRKAPAAIIGTSGGVRALNLGPESVDVWSLLQQVSESAGQPSHLIGTPFAGVEVSGRIRFAIDQVDSARRDLLMRWEADESQLSSNALTGVRALIEQEPYDESFNRVAVLLHLRSGDVRGARLVVELVRRAMDEISSHESRAVSELEELVEATPSAGSISLSESIRPGSSQSPALVKIASVPMFGRLDLLERLNTDLVDPDSRGLILEGDEGVGKSRIAAELANEMGSAGYHTVYVAASERFSSSLQPFIEAFDGLADEIDHYLADRLDDPTERSRCWIAVLAFLKRHFGDRPLCLVIDDAQWLDPLSEALTAFLSRVDKDQRLTLIVTGRPLNRSSTSWPTLIQELMRIGLPLHHVAPMTEADVETMIARRHRRFPSLRLASLAKTVHQLSGGLPAVATWLTERLDPTTGEPPSGHLGKTGYSILVATLSEQQREFGAAAAVLGPSFSIDELPQLTGFSIDQILELAEELCAIGLTEETARPGEYRFSHLLAVDAFSEVLSPARRVRLHRDALEHTADIHRRAWHTTRSVPLSTLQEAAEALLESARVHFQNGNYPDAAQAIEQATVSHPQSVGLDHQIVFAEALERSGRSAADLRAAIVKSAVEAGDPRRALDASITGLPATEKLDGDPDRIELIESIDPQHLEHGDAIRRAVHLSRQLVLAGRLAEAGDTAEQAFQAALSPEDKAETWLTIRHAEGWAPRDAERLDQTWISDLTDQRLLARIREARAITAFADGMTELAESELDDHVEQARHSNDTLTLWYALLLQTTARTEFGKIDGAREAAREAREIGLRFGLAGSALAAQAQEFNWIWLENQHHTLVDFMDEAAADAQQSVLFQAGFLLSRFAAGKLSKSTESAESVRRLMDEVSSSRFEVGVLGILAEVIGASEDRGLAQRAADRLEDHRNQNIIVGAAMTNLGPCTLTLARLSRDPSSKIAILREAVSHADANPSPLWRVKTRLELAAALDGQSDEQVLLTLQEAATEAVTPWLRSLVDAASPGIVS